MKAFEDRDEVIAKLRKEHPDRIYLANTTNKSSPEISICDVGRIITDKADIDKNLVPEYYREKVDEVPIWFEVVSRIGAIDADERLKSLLRSAQQSTFLITTNREIWSTRLFLVFID